MNRTLELMSAHRTIRKFAPRELPDSLLRDCVRCAQQAATSSNVQAYSLLRVVDAAQRARLAALSGGQPQVAGAGAFFVVCADQRRHRLIASAAGKPYVANLETFLVALIDASLFAQNLALAFESEGLGICYIGGLRNELAEVDGLLGLPADVLPLYGLCVGVPADQPGQRPRLPLDAVYFEGSYPSDEQLGEQIADYDRTMSAYYDQRGQSGHDWSGAIWRKFQQPNRAHLAGFFSAKGARLE